MLKCTCFPQGFVCQTMLAIDQRLLFDQYPVGVGKKYMYFYWRSTKCPDKRADWTGQVSRGCWCVKVQLNFNKRYFPESYSVFYNEFLSEKIKKDVFPHDLSTLTLQKKLFRTFCKDTLYCVVQC